MHIHNILLHENYLKYVKNRTKTVCGIPLKYNGIQLNNLIKNGDIVILYNRHGKKVIAFITEIICYFGNYEIILTETLKNNLPNVKSVDEAKKKYIKWYGEKNLENGMIILNFELVENGIGC